MEIRNYAHGVRVTVPPGSQRPDFIEMFFWKNLGRVSIDSLGEFTLHDNTYSLADRQFKRTDITLIEDNGIAVPLPGTDAAMYVLLTSYFNSPLSPTIQFTVNTNHSRAIINPPANAYLTSLADNGAFIFWNPPPLADRTFTFPTGLPVGWNCIVMKYSAGNTITFAGAVGVTVLATQLVMSAQYAYAFCTVIQPNVVQITYAPDRSIPVLLLGANNYFTSPADKGSFAYWNPPAATRTFNVPTGLPVGWNIKLFKLTAGDTITIVGAVGVTLNGPKIIAQQYAIANLIVVAPDVVMIDISPDPTKQIKEIVGNNYATIEGDDGFVFTWNAAANKTFDLPLNLPVGWNCIVIKNFGGVNNITFTGAVGVTLQSNNLVMANQNSMAQIFVIAPNIIYIRNQGL